jgi:hypothetical protein
MVELLTTAIVTVSSALLFSYWLRCAFRLLREECPNDNPSVLINSPLPIPSTAEIS